MNKAEFINVLAEKSGLSKKDSEKALNAFFEVTKETLGKGENIQFVGFGSFEVVQRPERTGKNPRTGEEMIFAASKAPKFKPGKAFKDAVK